MDVLLEFLPTKSHSLKCNTRLHTLRLQPQLTRCHLKWTWQVTNWLCNQIARIQTLRCSNTERLDVFPRSLKLSPQASAQIELKLFSSKPFHKKALKVKDFLFIKSDFFDQKIPIYIYPGSKSSFTVSSGSLQRATMQNQGIPSPQSRNMITLAGESFGRQTFQNEANAQTVNHNSSFERDEDNNQESAESTFLHKKVLEQTKEIQDLKFLLSQSQDEVNALQQQFTDAPSQLDKIREMLREREPNLQRLLDETLRQERQSQEKKEQKVLQILLQKDRLIEQLRTQALETEQSLKSATVQNKDLLRMHEQLEQKLQSRLRQINTLEIQLAEAKDMLQEFSSTDLMKTQAQIQSQSAYVRDLENQVKSYQDSSKNESFFSEALERSKHEIGLKQTQLKQILKEMDHLRALNKKLEQQLEFTGQQLDQYRQSDLNKKKSDISNMQSEKRLQSELERLKTHVNEVVDKQKSAKNVLARITGASADVIDIDEAANLIVSKFEQLLNDYSSLEKEMRQLAQQDGTTSSEDNENRQEQNMQSVQSESERSLDQQGLLVEKLKEKIGEQDLQIRQLTGILKATGNENLFHNQSSTLGGKSDGTQNNIILVSDTLQVGSSSSVKLLNTKIQEMKLREDKLVQQISNMRNQIKYQASTSQPDINLVTYQDSTDRSSVDLFSIRVGELENVILKQREQLISLEDQLIDCRRKLQDQIQHSENKIELLNLRNKNLQELNRKIDTIQINGGASSSDFFGTLKASPQTAIDTERMRQAVQTADLSNMELKHTCQELTLQRDKANEELNRVRGHASQIESQLVRAQQDLVVMSVGLNSQDSQLTVLIQDQKSRIIQLEQALKQQPNKNTGGNMNLVSIHEEFIAKAEQITERSVLEKQQLTTQIIQANQKIENLKAQLHMMEKKEVKAQSQFEVSSQESVKKLELSELRLVETERLVDAKNSLIAQLERDLHKAEGTLQERQEQLSVLLSAMDNGSGSTSDIKQKLANLAAELCQVMQQKAALEQKIGEASILQQQTQSQNLSLNKDLNLVKDQQKSLQAREIQLQKRVEQQERKIQDLEMQMAMQTQEISDSKYNSERLQFHLKTKEEAINTIKDNQRKCESQFKEQIQHLKQSLLERGVNQQGTSKRYDNDLKIAIQKLNLAILEMDASNTDTIFKEFQNTVHTSAQIVEKLQFELEAKQAECHQLNLNWDALTLNKILTLRYEQSLATTRQTQQLLGQREVELAAFHKCTIDQQINNVVSDLENQLESTQNQCAQLNKELGQVQQLKSQLESECCDLKKRVTLFEAELKADQVAMEKKAEITLDERHRAMESSLRTYFDSHLTKLIVGGTNSQDMTLELGREICALKLLINQFQNQVSFGKSKVESLETALKFQKSQQKENQTLIHKLENKIEEQQKRFNAQQAQQAASVDKLKKQVLKTEKELIRANELVQQKSREISQLKINQVQSNTSMDSANATLALSSPASIQENQLTKRVQELQEEVIELRQGRMFETDELRLQYELEFAELKRNINIQQQEEKKRFHPSQSPKELFSQNSDLIQQIEQMKEEAENQSQEHNQLQQHCEELEQYAQNLSMELEDVKNAMQELQIVFQNQTDIGYLRNSVNSQNQFAFTDQKRSKSALKNSKVTNKTVELSAQKQQEIHFSQNPPALVRALVQSKINEQHVKSKLRRQLQVEANLRQMMSKKLQPCDIVSELIKQNEAILQILNQEQQSASLDHQFTVEQEECQEEDYQCLVMGVLALAVQLAQKEQAHIENTQLHERLPLNKIVQAQRIVIKSLAAKNQDKIIRYIPERDQDRKIWFLQLLESQVNDAELQTDRLVDFIKRLQVAVSGNLQSAAEIRATSIDLAQNTKETSDEIKTLRHIAALMKHDVQMMCNTPRNPFQEDLRHTNRDDQSMTARSTSHAGLEKLMTERDSAQNQLSLTSKIKQSLEQELVSLKLQHANELQSQIQSMRNLHSQTLTKDKQLEKLNNQLNEVEMQRKQSEQQLQEANFRIQELEDKYEKVAIKVEKTAGSTTSLRKLQSDMQEWRKQSEANLKHKQEALETCQADLQKARTEVQRLKSENQMLRRVQSDIRSGEEQMNFLRELEQLRLQLQQSLDQREQEKEQVITEQNQLRQKIAQLESALSLGDNATNKETQQLSKFANQLKNELKTKQAELIAAKDILTQTQIQKVAVETKLQECQASLQLQENKVAELKQSLKSANQETEYLRIAKQSAIENQDKDASQIAQEMIGLRETFMKLKAERDSLALQLSQNQQVFDKKDKEWRSKVSELQGKLERIEGTYVNKATESHESVLVLSERNKVLLNDLKYFKEQYEKVQGGATDLIQKATSLEALLQTQQQEQAGLQQRMDQMRKEIAELKSLNSEKDHQLRESELQVVELEACHNEKLKVTQQTYTKLRVETQAAMQALSQQIMILKQKGDKQKPVKEIDQALQITQKEVALKQLRKELALEKQKVVKLKQQKTDLKDQLQPDTKDQKQKGKSAPVLPKWKEEMLELIKDSPALKKLLKQTREQNTSDAKVIELQAECHAHETEAFRLRQTTEELQFKIEELQQLILDAKSSAKGGKSTLIEKHNNVVNGLKDQIRSLNQQLSVMKEEFVSPSEQQPLIDQIRDLQQALKSAQSDLVRKNKLITTLRQQKDSSAQEVDLVLQDLKGLREENQRLQKALREGKSSNSDLKEMRETYEWLQRQEKQMKEEIVSLHERNKTLKLEVSRKDTQIREYRDQCHQKSKDVDVNKEISQQIEKLKDDKKRLKLELDIKDNQIRSLKQHIEQLKSQPAQDSRQSQQNYEQELRQSKQKAKKYESHLKRSIQVIAKMGTGLVQMMPEERVVLSSNSKTERSDMLSQAEYLKDAGQILGVSMHELEDFMNATPNRNRLSHRSENSHQSILGKLKKLPNLPDTLDEDIEEIGEYCVKLIGDMQGQQQ